MVFFSTYSYLLQFTMFYLQRVNDASRTWAVQSSILCFARRYYSFMSARYLDVLSRIYCKLFNQLSKESLTPFSTYINLFNSSTEPYHLFNPWLEGLQESGQSFLLLEKSIFLLFYSGRMDSTRLFLYELLILANTSPTGGLISCQIGGVTISFFWRAAIFIFCLSSTSSLKLSSLRNTVLLVSYSMTFLSEGFFFYLISLMQISSSRPKFFSKDCSYLSESLGNLLRLLLFMTVYGLFLEVELEYCDQFRLTFCLGLKVPWTSLVGVRKLTTLSFSMFIIQNNIMAVAELFDLCKSDIIEPRAQKQVQIVLPYFLAQFIIIPKKYIYLSYLYPIHTSEYNLILQQTMKAKTTGIVYDEKMLLHKSKRRHPESPKRLIEIIKTLTQSALLEDPRVDFVDHYDRKVTNQEIMYVYPQKYVKYIEDLWPKASHRKDLTVLDTYFCEHSESAARISAGGVLLALDKIVQGQWKNGYSIIRPPGHHSGYRNTINGFCIFNNVAIGAKYLQKVHGIKKVAIFDFDIHHGDGTQAVFDQDPNVLFISIHRYDHGNYYPAGDGHSMYNCGKGIGQGSKLNVPLNIGKQIQAPGDNEYIYLFKRLVQPIIAQFQPEFILISAGYDASRNDPIGGFTVTPNAYYYMTRQLNQMGVPVLAVLEGGYNYKQTAWASMGTLKGLLGEMELPQPINEISYENIAGQCHIENVYHQDFDEIIEHHAKYWKCLKTEDMQKYSRAIKKNELKKFGVFEQRQTSSSSEEEQQTVLQNKKKAQQPVYPKGFDTADQDESTDQFNFAAGHMQRFKNFSINSQQIHKWAYIEEVKFYESAFAEKKFAPKYFGRDGDYIIIENLLYNQEDHIVVDIKLSRNSKKPGLTEQKVEKFRVKESLSTTQKYSLRVSGFTTPTYKQTGLLIPDQNFLRKILGKTVTAENKQFYCTYLRDLIQQLKKANRKYFNTSILLIKGKTKSNIGWIDFHYYYQDCESYDKDLAEGLQNLIKFITEVQTSQTS